MNDKNVFKLVDKSENAKHYTPADALTDALDEIGKRGAFEKGQKLLILALDDNDGQFSVSFIQAGMKMSECLTLCEVAKSVFKKKMNY